MSDCIFCRIARGEIPSRRVYENEQVLAFHDRNPQAPVHVLIIPRMHIPSLDGVNEENSAVLARVMEAVPRVAREAGLTGGYRLISNCGKDACQSVGHLHFHLLGGTQLKETMG